MGWYENGCGRFVSSLPVLPAAEGQESKRVVCFRGCPLLSGNGHGSLWNLRQGLLIHLKVLIILVSSWIG